MDGYLAARHTYFGAIVGRYANRIRGACYQLDGHTVHLTANEGRNHLHGGHVGFDKHVWRAEAQQREDGVALTLSRTSEDGEEGYPGAVQAEVSYVLTADRVVRIEYRAVATRATVINMTNHSLFNLAGEGNGTILGHELQIAARAYTPIDDELIPTGELAPVEGSPLDFRMRAKIGARIGADHDQLRRAGGYDHNFVVTASAGPAALRLAARLVDPASRRSLEVHTTEPGLQVYTGNRLDGTLFGASGRPYERFAGIALEAQRFPDSPNRASFPSAVLRPGEAYCSVTELRLGVVD
jgi:aldose 1-epimerase